MNAGVAAADRRQQVRDAARSWLKAGAIDAAALAEIERRFADDCVRVGPVFRILLFVFTTLAVCAAWGMFALPLASLQQSAALPTLAGLAGGALFVATDYLQISRRRRQGGIEAATSLLALVGLGTALLWALDHRGDIPMRSLPAYGLVVAAVLCAGAAWRWGYPVYAGIATAALILSTAWLPYGRLLWIVLPLAAAPLLARGAESPRLPPAHRGSCAVALVTSLVALYAAVHVTSWRDQWIEELGERRNFTGAIGEWDGSPLFWCAAAATALLPVALLVLGVRRRRMPLLVAGAVTAVVALVTVRTYVHVLPLWAMVTLGGVLLLAVALGLQRYLETGPGDERGGFTAAPLFGSAARERLLEAGAAALAFAPAPAAPPGGDGGFSGQGGRSGGGGATGEF